MPEQGIWRYGKMLQNRRRWILCAYRGGRTDEDSCIAWTVWRSYWRKKPEPCYAYIGCMRIWGAWKAGWEHGTAFQSQRWDDVWCEIQDEKGISCVLWGENQELSQCAQHCIKVNGFVSVSMGYNKRSELVFWRYRWELCTEAGR